MFNLKTIAWKLCKAAKVHVATSIGIIAISVALIVTMATYNFNAQKQLEQQIDAMFGEMDLLAGYNYGQGMITPALYEDVQRLPLVDYVSPISLEMTQINELQSVYTLGVENDDLVKSRYHFTQNIARDEVVISELLAKTLSVSVGDSITLNFDQYKVIEILPTPTGAEPTNMALVQNDALKKADAVGLFMLIESSNPQLLTKQLTSIDEQLRIDLVDEYDFVKMNLQFLFVLTIIFSVFILFITALLLLSTMQLLFMKLKEQFMILRSLGATAKQIAQLIKVQLTIIMVVGLVSGLGCSFLIVRFALPSVVSILQLPEASTTFPFTIALLVVGGMGLLLMLYSKWQVQKAIHILPLQMKEQTVNLPLKLKTWRTIVVCVSSLIGALFLTNGVVDTSGIGALQILVGSLLLTGGVLYFIPYCFQWLMTMTLQPIRKILGKEAFLALKQLIPQIKINKKIVLSIIGLMVILVFGSATLKTLKSNNLAYIEDRFETDLIIKNNAFNEAVGALFIEEVRLLPGVDDVQATSIGASFLLKEDSTRFDAFAVNLKKFGIRGDVSQKIVITKNFAEDEQIRVGDMIAPYFLYKEVDLMEKQQPFEVAAIIEEESPYPSAYIDWSSPYAKEQLFVYELMVDGESSAQMKEAILDLLSLYPGVQLLEKEQEIQEANQLFSQSWSLFIGIFTVLLIATTIGIIQTLLHLIYSNRAQYTIQRMLGLSPNGLIILLCMQVLSFVLYGIGVGILIGGVLTQLISLIDTGRFLYDYVTLGLVSGGLIIVMLIVFGTQGYILSRQKLSKEMQHL